MRDEAAHEANRISWNRATRQHNGHKGDQAAFFRQGGSTLYPEERALLGDVAGRSLLHLQCNAGQDTLSLVAHHDVTATGVDISDEAIRFARTLSQESGIEATFVRADIYDWFVTNSTQFDIVFMTYGTLCWLSDMTGWGQGVAAALKPGGRFVLVEFHPLMGILTGALNGDWSQAFDYMGGQHYRFEFGVGDYVGESEGALLPDTSASATSTPFVNPDPSHEFAWGIADVLGALLGAGLGLRQFKEYAYSNGFKPFPQLESRPGRRFAFPESMPIVPLMYGIEAVKF